MADDVIVQQFANTVAVAGAVSKKPNYLIIFEAAARKKKEYFITIDIPEFLRGFIHARGYYCDLEEKKIMENYSTILTDNPKELCLDMYFPWHKISSIKNLVFKSK